MSLLDRFFRRLPRLTKGDLSNDTLVHLVGREDPVFVEIGTNDGRSTQRFLNLFPGSRMYCFEPDHRAAAKFRARVTDPRVTFYPRAVSDKDGSATFHLSGGLPPDRRDDAERYPEGWDLSSSLKTPQQHLEVHPWCTFDEEAVVETVRLDTWYRNAEPGTVDFIWADTQGAEADVIQGGGATLAHTRFFYTEYSNRELYEGQLGLKQLMRLLPGFEVLHRYRNDVLFRNRSL